MTKTDFRYEKPVLVGLNDESVVGVTSCGYGGAATKDECQFNSVCQYGTKAGGCMTGTDACENRNCFAYCSGGSIVVPPSATQFTCAGGSFPYQNCYIGSNAYLSCKTGTMQGTCL